MTSHQATAHRKLAIVLSHPTQYYSPWFRWLSAHGWCLRVFYLWDFGVSARRDRLFDRTVRWDIDLLSGYEHEFVRNLSPFSGTHHLWGMCNPGLPRRLKTYNPDAVLLFGYKYLTHLWLILSAQRPLIFRGDSHLLGCRLQAGPKSAILSRLYSRFDAITYVGQANRQYFRQLGVPESKLHFAPHCVDATRFTATDEARSAAQRARAEIGLSRHRIVLFAGKFIARKQPLELLRAFQDLSPANTALVFVGDGPEKVRLEACAATTPDLPIRFLPFANQTDMPARYLMADLFVLPSVGLGETWGLAINEAMHLGIPCLVSDQVGCQPDLVTEGDTGWVFRADSPADLRRALRLALSDLAHDAPRFAAAAQLRVSRYSFDTAADGLNSAVAAALARRKMN